MTGKIVNFKQATKPIRAMKNRGAGKMIGQAFRLARMMARRQSMFLVEDALGLKWGICIGGPFAATLKALIDVGDRGITAADMSRWTIGGLPEYVDLLRNEYGLDIESVCEDNGRTRHFLKSDVRLLAGLEKVA